MIWLAATLAFAQDVPPAPVETPDAAAQTARLLGPAPEATPTTPLTTAPRFALPLWWPLGLAAAGAGLVWFARRQKVGANPFESALVVVGRTSLGGSSALLLVDVTQPDGAQRRLVIATGSGTPTLLADLGDDSEDDEQDQDVEHPVPLTLRADPYASAAAAAKRPDRKAAAMALIDEVVGTRRVGHP